MAEILIRGGDAEAAAKELAAAVQEILTVQPVRTDIGGAQAPNTRALMEIAAICLAFPPAVVGVADILARMQLGDRLRRLIAKAASLHKATRATILIDAGDGKPIPLEEARHDAILAALRACEQRLKA